MSIDLEHPSHALGLDDLLALRGKTVYGVRHAAQSSHIEVVSMVLGPVFVEYNISTFPANSRFEECLPGRPLTQEPIRYHCLDPSTYSGEICRAWRLDYYGIPEDDKRGGYSALFADEVAARSWGTFLKMTHSDFSDHADAFWRFQWGLAMSKTSVERLFNFDFG